MKKDKNMRNFSLKENLYWIKLNPVFFMKLILKRPLIKLLNKKAKLQNLSFFLVHLD